MLQSQLVNSISSQTQMLRDEIATFLNEIRVTVTVLKSQLNASNKQIQVLKNQLNSSIESTSDQLTTLESQLNTIKEEIRVLSSQLNSSTELSNATITTLELTVNQQIQVLSNSSMKQYSSILLALESRLNATKKQINVLNASLEESSVAFMTWHFKLNDTVHMLKTQLEYSIDQSQAQIIELVSQVNSTNQNISTLQLQLNTTSEQTLLLRNELNYFIDQSTGTIMMLGSRLTLTEEQIAQLNLSTVMSSRTIESQINTINEQIRALGNLLNSSTELITLESTINQQI